MRLIRVALCVPELGSSGVVINAPPLNLASLASYLRENFKVRGCRLEVKIFDGAIGHNIRREIFHWQPTIVGISFTTPLAPEAYELGDRIGRSRPDILRVMGGVHPTVMPNEAIEHCDCVVEGEGEKALLGIVEAMARKDVVAIIPHFIHGDPVENLDDIPPPAFDLLEIEKYLVVRDSPGQQYPFGLKETKIGTLMTSRGCPFKCVFCVNSKRKAPVRYHSAERVVQDIEYLVQHHDVNSLFFLDDEFLINWKRLERIMELLEEKGISLPWGCQARASTLTYARMVYLKKHNCKFASVGFESFNPRILSLLKKGSVSVLHNIMALDQAKKAGFLIGGSFVFGYPSETKEEALETLKAIEDHDELVFAGINVLIPYPGTEIFDLCMEQGLLPNPLDYHRLVPTSRAEDTYIVSISMSKGEYRRLLVNIQRVAFVYSKVRLLCGLHKNPLWKFVKLFRHKVYWWMLLRHPRKTWRLIWKVVRQTLKGRK